MYKGMYKQGRRQGRSWFEKNTEFLNNILVAFLTHAPLAVVGVVSLIFSIYSPVFVLVTLIVSVIFLINMMLV